MTRATSPQVSFADLEFRAQNIALDPLLEEVSHFFNQHVVLAAVALKLEDGQKLRTDTTVVETDIHHPTDSTLLWDTVRVLSRLVGRLDQLLPRGVRGFTNHRRSARRRMQEIQRMSAQQRHDQLVPKYRQLIRVGRQVVAKARQVLKQTQNAHGKTPLDDLAIQAL